MSNLFISVNTYSAIMCIACKKSKKMRKISLVKYIPFHFPNLHNSRLGPRLGFARVRTTLNTNFEPFRTQVSPPKSNYEPTQTLQNSRTPNPRTGFDPTLICTIFANLASMIKKWMLKFCQNVCQICVDILLFLQIGRDFSTWWLILCT